MHSDSRQGLPCSKVPQQLRHARTCIFPPKGSLLSSSPSLGSDGFFRSSIRGQGLWLGKRTHSPDLTTLRRCDGVWKMRSMLVGHGCPRRIYFGSVFRAKTPIGLFAPRAGQYFRDEQRRRRSQYDRGTRLAEIEDRYVIGNTMIQEYLGQHVTQHHRKFTAVPSNSSLYF